MMSNSNGQKGGGVDIRDYIKMYTGEDPAPDINGSQGELTEVQVKFEVEDPDYEHSLGEGTSVSAGLLRSFHPHPPQQQTPPPPATDGVASSQSAAQWTGSSSAIRTELRKIMEDKTVDPSAATQNVHTIIERLLKKNENVLAQNEMHGYKPGSRRGRPPLEGSKSKDAVFPTAGQSVSFPAGQHSQGRVSGGGGGGSHRQSPQLDQGVQLGQLMRPKSPTRRCAIPDKDKSHFNLALMESKVGDQESETIFKVQEHEMVCAISSQTKFLNKEGRLVSSVDINYYWCNFCQYSTTNKAFLMQHVMEHRFHCKHCRYQSFSRADVIHHSVHAHPAFQDTASITQYCTLLPDYLRVHNPTEATLDNCRKRKDPPLPPPDEGGEIENYPLPKKKKGEKKKVRKSYSADFDLFDVSVEDLKDKGEEEGESGNRSGSASSSSTVLLGSTADPGVSQSLSNISLISQPMSTVTSSISLSGTQPVITQVFSVAPPPSTSSSTAFDGKALSISPPPQPPPTPLYPNSVGAGAMQQIRSNLYWSCGYCSFTSTSQSLIKEHSVLQHAGKPHRYVALIKSEAGSDEASTPPPPPPLTTAGNGDQASESDAASEPERGKGECEDAEEPPVLVKQEPMEVEESASAPIRLRFPTPRQPPKDPPTTLKCLHCSHTARSLNSIRNHILSRHKGKSLVGVGGVSSRVFMCPRTDCTFRSASALTFLTHSLECTNPDSPEEEPHLKKCLEATTRYAEDMGALSSSSTPPASSSSQTMTAR